MPDHPHEHIPSVVRELREQAAVYRRTARSSAVFAATLGDRDLRGKSEFYGKAANDEVTASYLECRADELEAQAKEDDRA